MTNKFTSSSKYEYEIALSFAGEERDYVEDVAILLKEKGIKVFYDQFEEASLWGKDLYVHLDQVYRLKAQYSVLFLSKNYAAKVWTNHERKSAQTRAFKEQEEYILPARFDDTEIPGISSIIGYIDLRDKSPEQLANLIVQKLDKSSESLIENEDEDIEIEPILSYENRKYNLIQNGEEIFFLNSKSTRGPAECTIYANTVNRFYEKAYKLETYIQGMTLAELEKIIRIYYSTFRYRHYVSAFGINQEACSWFGFGPLNFLKALKMQDIRYAEMKNNNEYIHHNEAATFIDEMSDAIFYISSQPSKKRKQDDLVTLDRVNIGFIFSKNPYNNIYHDFFEKIGSIPGFVDEINEPPTVSKKMNHTITEEGYIIDDPNEEFGGWVSGIFGNNVTNSKLTEINNEKIIVNFNQYHEMKDICNYEISSVHATYIHTLFSTIIVNYKGDWSII